MSKEFAQIEWDTALEAECRRILQSAFDEDLQSAGDLTTDALVDATATGRAAVVARQAGVVAGLPAGKMAVAQFDPRIQWRPESADGSAIEAGSVLATIAGPVRSLLSVERTLLNLLGRLSGIATLTRRFVDAVAPAPVRIYDTRKTTPGWRRLEKYAVRRGGGWNHRLGLFDAILIKDNHLAVAAAAGSNLTPAAAVRRVRERIKVAAAKPGGSMIVEIEVDTLDQLREVLSAGPDIVLLDNMPPAVLRQAVAIRDESAQGVELEASGGITLTTIAEIARTGVERISVGALTHSAIALDIGLDWQ
ncbi:MAG TPA: carboxylating nicotinate-nucleotide diphosphorylase [Pirellulales bacterium]|jgi:nicotinate-nucleotide pyrophosphorylase (carboxylating)|nr:carboxylating nicotinate-nucleotide diphosphorylase [Pirellulales bacterium]